MDYTVWTVGEKDYMLFLDADAIRTVESNVLSGRSLSTVVSSIASMLAFPDNPVYVLNSMPSLDVMLGVLQYAAVKFNHGTSKKTINAMYDKYRADGGTMVSLFQDVFVPLLVSSGFFIEPAATKTEEKPEKNTEN